ncbi:hypothetical protein ACFFRR_009023 [Megaselia abdita]
MLSVYDYVVLVAVLITSASIGIYYRITGGKQKTTTEYLLADRSMSALPVSFTLMASFMSAITLLGVSTESYQFGILFVVINISYILTTPLAAYLYLPVFYKLQTTSVYEYLELRFGKTTRLVSSIAYSTQMILYMGIVLYAPALALEAITGINKTVAILAIGLVCTFYSTIGGMKAVIVTDVFQSFLMFGAVLSICITAIVMAGGVSEVWNTADAGGRIEFLNFDIDPTTRHSWWSLIIGGGIIYLSLYGVNQTQVQRLMTVKTLKSAERSLWLNLPILSALSFSTLFSGLSIYYYYKDCDPLLNGRITTRDQMMPLFVIDTMGKYPGLAGLFVSGIFSGSLSTVSSSVSSLAAVTLEDYLKPAYLLIMKKPMLETNTTLPSKIMACFYGIVCIGLAFLAGSLGGVLQASLTIFGVVGGPLLGVFTLGMFTTKSNQKGVISGFVLGLIFGFFVGFGGPKPPLPVLDFSTEGCSNNATIPILTKSSSVQSEDFYWIYRVSYLWYPVMCFVITTVFGYVFSLIYELLKLDDNRRIYKDNYKLVINYDLFIPPLAKRLRSNNNNVKFDPEVNKELNEY